MDFSIRAAEPDVHPLPGQPRRRRRESPPREFEEQLEHPAQPASPAPERVPHGGAEEGVGTNLDVVA